MDSTFLYSKYCSHCRFLGHAYNPVNNGCFPVCLINGEGKEILRGKFKIPCNCIYRLETLMEDELKNDKRIL